MTCSGFAPELIPFLNDLGTNNNREWFVAHRQDYEQYFLEPARESDLAMAECLPRLGADIHADPKVRRSIFAINRDTRFSSDKTPYKTYLDLWFWQGSGPSRERPGDFFRLMPERLVLGAEALKRLPSGVLADHPRAECFAQYERLAPLQQWLVDVLPE